MAKLQPADIKGKKLVPAEEPDLDSKVDKYVIINVKDLNRFEDGTEVTPEVLLQAGLIKSLKEKVKILGDGELDKKLVLKVNKVSQQAQEKVTAKGGKVEVI